MQDEPDSSRAFSLIERELNRAEVERRLARLHGGAGVGQRTITIVSGLVTAGVGAWLVAGLATAPANVGPPPRLGVFAGLLMLAGGTALAVLGGCLVSAAQREKRQLRALLDLLGERSEPLDPGGTGG